MRKQIFVSITLTVLTVSTYLLLSAFIKPISNNPNSEGKIRFIEEDWNLAMKTAVSERKYIFVDAYASWCGPCKLLKATTFKNNKAAAFFNQNFVNLSIDMEKGQGPALAKKWGIRAYPTLIIFTPDGKPVIGTVGLINGQELIRFGEEGLLKGKLVK